MATRVVMEALSPTMEEGRLVAWKKREGEVVKAGDVLAEVETDKAVMEMVARTDGVLRKILIAEGETVPVSSTVGIIAGADEDIADLTGGQTVGRTGGQTGGPSGPAVAERGLQAATTTAAAPVPAGPRAEAPAAIAPRAEAPAAIVPRAEAPAAIAPRAEAPARQEPVLKDSSPDRVKSSPLARRLAAEKGVNLAAIQGSGPAGRVIARDVETAGTGAPGHRGTEAVSPPVRPSASPSGFRDVPLTQIRKTIAKRLAQSIGPIPHFFLTSEIDMERAWDARAALKALKDAAEFSFNDLVIKAVALALRQHPAVNAWWMDDHIRYHGDVHVGMAVAVEEGLITPVIRFADRKGLTEIGAEARALADKARARRLTPEEYTGATFSVSNLGMLDIDEFTAVINPPEAAILAVGRIAQKPVVVDGIVGPRRRMRVTMSCDHRVIDGATGARFLQTVKLMLENPLAMVL